MPVCSFHVRFFWGVCLLLCSDLTPTTNRRTKENTQWRGINTNLPLWYIIFLLIFVLSATFLSLFFEFPNLSSSLLGCASFSLLSPLKSWNLLLGLPLKHYELVAPSAFINIYTSVLANWLDWCIINQVLLLSACGHNAVLVMGTGFLRMGMLLHVYLFIFRIYTPPMLRPNIRPLLNLQRNNSRGHSIGTLNFTIDFLKNFFKHH